MPFERDEDISRHLLAVSRYPGRAINEDAPRANNNPLEMQATRSAARTIMRLEHAEKMFNWDLTNMIEFFEGTRSITDVTGRGKNGWMARVTKTKYNVEQLDAAAMDNGLPLGEEAKQSLQQKIAAALPFGKKQGDVNNG